MEGVHAYSVKEGIPYKHILLDSWWYTKGSAGGVKEWDATTATFPDGLKKFADKTGWQFQMHNRYWSASKALIQPQTAPFFESARSLHVCMYSRRRGCAESACTQSRIQTNMCVYSVSIA